MTDTNENRRTAYDQLCISYHAIDDFRAKLLGFLPLVTGGGLILLARPAGEVRTEFFRPVGFLGFAVTIGLLVYELNGVKRCRELIDEGKDLERGMQLRNGQFINRHDPTFSIVTKPFAAAVIYPAVLAAWTYLALFVDHRDLGTVISPVVLVAGLVGILLYDQSRLEEPKLRWLFNRAQAATSTRGPAATAVTSTLHVSYHQYYLSDSSMDIAEVPWAKLFRGGNGLIAVTPGFAVVHTGTHTGHIQVTVDPRPAPPPLDLAAWQEVVEVSFTSTTGQVWLIECEGPARTDLGNLTPAGPGSYRLRVHARGRDQAAALHIPPEQPLDEYLIVSWPASPSPEHAHKHTDQYGQRIRSAPPAERQG